jgi:phage shock protein PspC (stress-responsive transcriptional regulator)
LTRKPRRRRLRLGRVAQARLGWWFGWAVVCAGLYLAFGLPPTLVVAGLVIALTFLALHDVDEPAAADEEVRLR